MDPYSDSIRFLYSLQTFGMKFGLENERRLLRVFGHPERAYPCVHIAGSNGKGTTAALIAAALTASGYRTGLYGSPHLVDFTERIRVDGRPIPEREVVHLLALLRPEIVRSRSTFFEAVTAIAFEHFRRSGVHIAVLEAGLGGRLDATNVVRPLVSVITSIAREHENILGRGLARIASEKGGIIKRAVPCVVGDVGIVPERVLRRIALKQAAPYKSLRSVKSIALAETVRQTNFRLRGLDGLEGDYVMGFIGREQVRNAALAAAALAEIRDTGGFEIPQSAVARAFGDCRRLSGLRSRFEVFGRRPMIIADVAHNPAAIRSLTRTLERLRLRDLTVVFGLMRDKNLTGIARQISRVARHVVAVQPRTERARASEEIAQVFRKLGCRSTDGGGVASGMRTARRISAGGVILVTGSHFVVGEMLAARWRKNYLTINQ